MNDQIHPWIENYAPGVDWALDLEPGSVFSMLDETAVSYGDRPAFDFLGKKYNSL